MKLDEKLVHLRKEKGLTQLELAEAVRVSRQAVSKWELGGAIPSIENLRKLSELFGVPINYLINEESKRPVCLEKEGENRKSRKWRVWLICVVIAVAMAVAIYIGVTHQNAENRNFNEMKSEQWEKGKEEEFSLNW